tara:strand:+ start:135 stop:350 length:216 start_codon:yes stop_codon:yes gene_type:complete
VTIKSGEILKPDAIIFGVLTPTILSVHAHIFASTLQTGLAAIPVPLGAKRKHMPNNQKRKSGKGCVNVRFS